jgi:polysaccharide deacetylase 2 family uncharacterized protein YibQ
METRSLRARIGHWRPFPVGWHGLLRFWVGLFGVLAFGAAVLQALGPPPPKSVVTAATQAGPAPAPAGSPPPAAPAPAATPPPPAPATETSASAAPGSVAAPDPALEEASSAFPGGTLPRIGPDGRMPMKVYAAPFDPGPAPTGQRLRVALLLGGIGLSEPDSEAAIRDTPGAVSFAVSPYAYHPERLLAAARAAGHELLLALPLEPDRYPIDDPGNHALLTGNSAALNHQRLEWALTRFTGYVGATGALNGMRGERFAAAPELMDPLLQELARRGLLYVDPRSGAAHPPYVVGRSVDVVVDEPAVRTGIEANLARLEQVARDRGAALGLVGVPRPVTLDRIAAWTATLATRGLVLAPVSAVVEAPPRPARTTAGASQ